MNKRIKAALRYAFDQQGAAGRHMHSVIAASQQEYVKKAARRRIGMCSFLLRQAGFVGWRIWLAQAVSLVVMLLGWRTVFSMDTLYLAPRHIPALLSCCGILTVLTAAPMFGRAVRFGMLELECATRYSYMRLMAARLVIVAIGDVAMLCGTILFAAAQTDMGLSGILFYAMVPSALLSAVLLLLLPGLSPRWAPGFIWAAGVFEMGIIWLMNRLCPSFGSQVFGLGWAILCAAMLLVGIWRAAHACRRAALADKQYAAI